MNQEEKIIENLIKCTRFSWCSINICPLDPEANLRTKLPEESCCPFTINKRGRGQKGIRILARDSILEVIPKSNVKMLNKGNLKRWHSLHQNNGEK